MQVIHGPARRDLRRSHSATLRPAGSCAMRPGRFSGCADEPCALRMRARTRTTARNPGFNARAAGISAISPDRARKLHAQFPCTKNDAGLRGNARGKSGTMAHGLPAARVRSPRPASQSAGAWSHRTRRRKWRSRPVSRVLSWTVIPLGASSPIRSSNLPGGAAGRSMASLFGLAPGGVCRAGPLPDSRCALTAPFHPCLCPATPVSPGSRDGSPGLGGKNPAATPRTSPSASSPSDTGVTGPSAVSFCCTFRRLAPPRRYLAPCPVEPGLSSASARDDATVWPAPPRALSHNAPRASAFRSAPGKDAMWTTNEAKAARNPGDGAASL